MQHNQELSQLSLVQNSKKVFSWLGCPKCQSINYIKQGKSYNEKQTYLCKDCGRNFTENPSGNSYLPLSDDVWDARDLGLRVSEHNRQTTLVFTHIQQDWLKVVAKKFIRYMAATREHTTLRGYITDFNGFSEFLEKNHFGVNFKLNRDLIIAYVDHLNRKGLGASRKTAILSSLNTFFETASMNGWLEIPSNLVRLEDYPKHTKLLPRYIPEEVMQQLNQHLDSLPEPVMRMVLVIQECGLRINELLQLRINCLKQDPKGNSSIQFIHWKTKEETIIPISPESAAVIQEQQQYIQKHLGKDFKYLFCARKSRAEFYPKPTGMSDQSFINFLKKLAEEFDIQDSLGKRWDFQTHQFRHTVGTRMINNGVPQHIVQRYLGHQSPEMTMRYAHIHDETLRKEVEKYHESRVFNITGETVELERTALENEQDLEWFKKTVLAMALPHGWCGRPKVLGYCDLPPNSCLNCPYLRTNKTFLQIFKDELERTKEILAKARNCGWEIQVRMNEPIQENLSKLIKELEVESE